MRACRAFCVLAACLPLLATAACAHQPPVARLELRAQPLALPAERRLGRLELEGAWALTATSRDFGGISGAELHGDRLWLLSDRSRLLEFDWRWPRSGQAFRLPLLAEDRLRNRRGTGLDAEALLPLPDGGHLVADEGPGQLIPFPQHGGEPSGPPRTLAALAGGATNQGIEALARLPDGSLLALHEAEGADGLHAALRLLPDGRTEMWRYRAEAGFSPTDAVVAGDFVLVLERRLSLLGGWQARLVAIPLTTLPQGEGGVLVGRELGRLSGAELGENYEALAVATDARGYRLIVLSDDNFGFLQRTLLLLLRWRPDEMPMVGLATGEP